VRKITMEELGDLLEQPRLATLATYKKDGTILLSPVWFEWDGEYFWVSTGEGDIKDRHIQRQPLVSLCIGEEAAYPGRVVEASGLASKMPDPGGAALRRIASRYLGAEVADRWMALYPTVTWILFRIKPDRMRLLDHRDETVLAEARPQEPSSSALEPRRP
jgi:PPOX class probable F420-dependent enzyme